MIGTKAWLTRPITRYKDKTVVKAGTEAFVKDSPYSQEGTDHHGQDVYVDYYTIVHQGTEYEVTDADLVRIGQFGAFDIYHDKNVKNTILDKIQWQGAKTAEDLANALDLAQPFVEAYLDYLQGQNWTRYDDKTRLWTAGPRLIERKQRDDAQRESLKKYLKN